MTQPRQISGHTQVCFILGDPIAQVRTPQALNRHFSANGADAVMAPLHVSADDLEAALAFIRCAHNVRGTVVTVPHKTAAARLCDEVSERAAEACAVNVIRRTDNGCLVGDLLDGEGFVAGLRAAGISVAGARVYMTGAGGAARAVAFALAGAGVQRLEVRNRNPANAALLVGRIRASHPQTMLVVTADDPVDVDIAINATSLGLGPEDPQPFDLSQLTKSTTVADLVMDPEETALLRAARLQGCRVHPGRAMLEGQLHLLAEFLGLANIPAAEKDE